MVLKFIQGQERANVWSPSLSYFSHLTKLKTYRSFRYFLIRHLNHPGQCSVTQASVTDYSNFFTMTPPTSMVWQFHCLRMNEVEKFVKNENPLVGQRHGSTQLVKPSFTTCNHYLQKRDSKSWRSAIGAMVAARVTRFSKIFQKN